MNSGKKNVKICDFHYFLFEPTKNPKCWCKMIVRTMVELCAKFLISRFKIGGAMAIFLVPILILFLDVVFELIEARISFYIFFLALLSIVSVHCVCFQRNWEKRFNMKR